MASDPMEVEVVGTCPSCGGVGENWYTENPTRPMVCHVCFGARTANMMMPLAPGTLSAAIQRLGWAEWEFDLANKAWRAVMAGDEEDDQDASQAAFDRLRAATDARVAALAEVRRLRPTPPEGTNGK